MPAPAIIVDPAGRNTASVDRDGNLRVANWWVNPDDLTPDEVSQRKVYASQLKNNGSEDMTVDGSVTPVRFSLAAPSDRIVWVHQIRLVMHSTQANITNVEARRFGAAAASPGLTNGLQLVANQQNVQTELFLAPVQSIGQFERYAATGGRGLVNNIDSIAVGTDFLMVVIDLQTPVGLYPGSGDSIYIDVQDDLTAITLLEIDVFGAQELITND